MLDERFGDYSVRVSDDHRNYVLVRHGISEKSGEANERDVGFYSSLDHCLKELARREANYASTILEWLQRYREVLEELRRAF